MLGRLPDDIHATLWGYLDAYDLARTLITTQGWIQAYEDPLTHAIQTLSRDTWRNLCLTAPLSRDFILKHRNRISGYTLVQNPHMDLDLYTSLPPDLLPGLAYTLMKMNYPLDFLDHFAEKLNWDYILQAHHMSEERLRRFAPYFGQNEWEILSRPPYEHSSDFLVDYRNNLNWCILSRREWGAHTRAPFEEHIKQVREMDQLLTRCYS